MKKIILFLTIIALSFSCSSDSNSSNNNNDNTISTQYLTGNWKLFSFVDDSQPALLGVYQNPNEIIDVYSDTYNVYLNNTFPDYYSNILYTNNPSSSSQYSNFLAAYDINTTTGVSDEFPYKVNNDSILLYGYDPFYKVIKRLVQDTMIVDDLHNSIRYYSKTPAVPYTYIPHQFSWELTLDSSHPDAPLRLLTTTNLGGNEWATLTNLPAGNTFYTGTFISSHLSIGAIGITNTNGVGKIRYRFKLKDANGKIIMDSGKKYACLGTNSADDPCINNYLHFGVFVSVRF
jgi:hypothetical protein